MTNNVEVDMTADSGVTLGVDVGTSSICVCAVECATAKPIEVATVPNRAGISSHGADSCFCERYGEQDPMTILETVTGLVNKVRGSLQPEIQGLSLTGQMHGALLVDCKLRPLSRLITWQDTRALPLLSQIGARLEDIHPEARGCYVNSGYMAATLYWFCQTQTLPESAYRACFIHDWVRSCLTQERRVITDPTNAASSGVFDLRAGDWDWEAIEALGIPTRLFPPVKASTDLAGHTPDGIPVRCGLGDNQASVLGSCATGQETDCAVLNLGTGSQLSLVVDDLEEWREPNELRPYPGGKYLLVGASPNGGAVYALVGDFLRAVLDRQGECLSEEQLFTLMNRLAADAPPGAAGLKFNPFFYPERGRAAETASLTGLTDSNFSPANMTRALLEGVIGILYSMYCGMGKARSRIVGAGNGIKRNALIQSIVEQVFDLPFAASPYDEEAAYGAALCGAGRSGGKGAV